MSRTGTAIPRSGLSTIVEALVSCRTQWSTMDSAEESGTGRLQSLDRLPNCGNQCVDAKWLWKESVRKVVSHHLVRFLWRESTHEEYPLRGMYLSDRRKHLHAGKAGHG